MKIIKFVTPFLLVVILLTSIFVKSDVLAEQNNQKVTLETISGDKNILNDIKLSATVIDGYPLLQQWTLNADFNNDNYFVSDHKRTISKTTYPPYPSRVDIGYDLYDPPQQIKDDLKENKKVKLNNYYDKLPISIVSLNNGYSTSYDFDFIDFEIPDDIIISNDTYNENNFQSNLQAFFYDNNSIVIGDYVYFTLCSQNFKNDFFYTDYVPEPSDNSNTGSESVAKEILGHLKYSGKSGLFKLNQKTRTVELVYEYDISSESDNETITTYYIEKENAIALFYYENSQFKMSLYDLATSTMSEKIAISDTITCGKDEKATAGLYNGGLINISVVDNKLLFVSSHIIESLENGYEIPFAGAVEINRNNDKLTPKRLIYKPLDLQDDLLFYSPKTLYYKNDVMYFAMALSYKDTLVRNNYDNINILAIDTNNTLLYNGNLSIDISTEKISSTDLNPMITNHKLPLYSYCSLNYARQIDNKICITG